MIKKIVFEWILLLLLSPAYAQGWQKEEMEMLEEIYTENGDNQTNSIVNAATGKPVSATIFVNNSLSCCLAPVVGFFIQENPTRADEFQGIAAQANFKSPYACSSSFIIEQPLVTHFQVVWQTPFSPMTIYVLLAKINNSDLQPGDEIGIFDIDPNSGNEVCVGAGLLVEVLNGSIFLEITTSMNDGTIPGQANGFTVGNPIIYKFWTEETGEITSINAAYPYPGYDEVFTALGTAFTELSGIMEVNQTVNLQTGWNMMSFRVQPENPDMLAVVQPLISQGILYKVIDEKGGSIFQLPFSEPVGQWANTIGNMENTEGYYVKLISDGELPISGMPVEIPFEVPLSSGWNMISYPSLVSQNAEEVLQPLIATGIFNKMIDEEGGLVFHLPFPPPDGQWINTIGNLETSEGYFLKVNGDASLVFNEVSTVLKPSKSQSVSKKFNYFSPGWENNPFMPMHIALEAGQDMTPGDEIGVFDDDVCVGAGIYDGDIENPVIIICSMDDPDTGIVDGFVDGNDIFFRIWDIETQNLFINPEIEFIAGEPDYVRLETFAGRINSITTGILQVVNNEISLDVIPNPVSGYTAIEAWFPEDGILTITIHGIHSQWARKSENFVCRKGFFKVELTGTALQAGFYLLDYEYVYQNNRINGSKKFIKII